MHLFKPRKNATEAAFLRYGDMLYRLALTRIGNDADAQDAVQDVFTKFIVSNPIFKDEDHEKAWFLRTMINQCHDFARKQSLRLFMPLDDVVNVASDDESGLNEIIGLISQLSPIYADVVVLHSLEGFSIEETAKLLELSVSAVKMRLSRAKEMLQKLRKE